MTNNVFDTIPKPILLMTPNNIRINELLSLMNTLNAIAGADVTGKHRESFEVVYEVIVKRVEELKK